VSAELILRAGSAMQKANKLIVVNAAPYETRVATLESGILVELLIERGEDRNSVGNIYNGKVIRVLPGMQAAFVDIGMDKAGSSSRATSSRPSSSSTPTRPRSRSCRGDRNPAGPLPQDTFIPRSRGSSGRATPARPGGQGAARNQRGEDHQSHHPPGRHLVLLTWSSNIGISRRIEDPEERDRLSKIVESIRPEGMGAIVRTAAEGGRRRSSRPTWITSSGSGDDPEEKRKHRCPRPDPPGALPFPASRS